MMCIPYTRWYEQQKQGKAATIFFFVFIYSYSMPFNTHTQKHEFQYTIIQVQTSFYKVHTFHSASLFGVRNIPADKIHFYVVGFHCSSFALFLSLSFSRKGLSSGIKLLALRSALRAEKALKRQRAPFSRSMLTCSFIMDGERKERQWHFVWGTFRRGGTRGATPLAIKYFRRNFCGKDLEKWCRRFLWHYLVSFASPLKNARWPLKVAVISV